MSLFFCCVFMFFVSLFAHFSYYLPRCTHTDLSLSFLPFSSSFLPLNTLMHLLLYCYYESVTRWWHVHFSLFHHYYSYFSEFLHFINSGINMPTETYQLFLYCETPLFFSYLLISKLIHLFFFYDLFHIFFSLENSIQ